MVNERKRNWEDWDHIPCKFHMAMAFSILGGFLKLF